MTLVSWRRPNCHVTECHMTLQVSHDTSVTVTFEVSHDAPPEPVMLRGVRKSRDCVTPYRLQYHCCRRFGKKSHCCK